jgi:L-ascorbate metabolism protein UlaG (beta-lactamase superfamily)
MITTERTRDALTMRRVVHASVLIEFGGETILADPYFSRERGSY